MAGSDVYNNASVVSANWSDTLTYTPASGSTPASVVVGGVAGSDVSLNGTVSAAGAAVTMTFNTPYGPIQEQVQAVFDIFGGAVFTDGVGDYFLFSDGVLTQGDTYQAVPGFGLFAAGAPNAACYAAGTRIATSKGEVAIEDLRPGDQVRALLRGATRGGFAPVVWTGRMSLACARHPRPHDVWPVRVAAHAFGRGRPARDLLLSPEHAIYAGGALVPVRHLLNDATITQIPVERMTYWHVELPAHDVLLAEGLAAESFLDTGNRGAFIAGPGSAAMSASTVVPLDAIGGEEGVRRLWQRRGCARLLTEDADLANLRRRLRAHARDAGWREGPNAGLELRAAGGWPLETGWDGCVAEATIPASVAEIRLHSRSTVPSRLGEGSTDGRRLGIAVTGLRIDGRDVPLHDARMHDGWHGIEDGWRWTDGDAAIALSPARRARSIEVRTAPMLPYWQAPAISAAARRAA